MPDLNIADYRSFAFWGQLWNNGAERSSGCRG